MQQTLLDMVNNGTKKEPEISFSKSDIEKRLCLPSGRFTSAGPVLPLVGAVVITVLFYGVLFFLPDTWFKVMFTQRGPVQYAIVFFSGWSITILLLKHSKIALQRRTLDLKILPEEDPGFVITPQSVDRVLERIAESVDNQKHFILTRRIQIALSNLRNLGNITDVDNILRTQADNDEALSSSSYTALRGFIWAIPVLGFIGTVLGLSQALGAFGSVLSHAAQISELRDSLQLVTSGLSTAFETTLVGLVAAMFIHLWMIAVQRREEQLLDECKDYSQKYIVGRLRLMTGTN
jgi:biopolymer transport protein ExbB/TolQ